MPYLAIQHRRLFGMSFKQVNHGARINHSVTRFTSLQCSLTTKMVDAIFHGKYYFFNLIHHITWPLGNQTSDHAIQNNSELKILYFPGFFSFMPNNKKFANNWKIIIYVSLHFLIFMTRLRRYITQNCFAPDSVQLLLKQQWPLDMFERNFEISDVFQWINQSVSQSVSQSISLMLLLTVYQVFLLELY